MKLVFLVFVVLLCFNHIAMNFDAAEKSNDADYYC